jgi:hypothetical protein
VQTLSGVSPDRYDTVYGAVLFIHSWIRWAALLLGFAATASAYRESAVPAASAGSPAGVQWDTYFQLSLDLQLLFGFLLYFGLSPFTRDALNDFGSSLRVPALSFWTVGHVSVMFLAVALVRIGRVLAMNAKTPASRRSRRVVCFSLAMVLILAGIPWPGLPWGRPLFRF